MKRPERQLYIPPALRGNFEKEHYQMDYSEYEYTSDSPNRQAYSLQNKYTSQRSAAYTDRRSVLYRGSSSSSNASISDESCKDNDSSDFEECCSEPVQSMSDEEVKRINENNCGDGFNHTRRERLIKNDDIETKNYLTNTEPSNRILPKVESCADADRENQICSSELSEAKPDRGLFFNDGDSSISDIEALIDTHTKKGKVLTSPPDSDIVEQKVLDAAKYVPGEEEIELESTLLSSSEATPNVAINPRDCNFEIYRDPSSAEDEPKGYSEILGSSYIPPPVPRTFPPKLPPIPRLPTLVLGAQRFPELRSVPALRTPQSSSHPQHPRLLIPPSLQEHPDQPSAFTALVARIPSCVRSALPRVSYVPLTTRPRPTLSPQRLTPPRSRQVTSNSQHLQPESLNPQGAQLRDQAELQRLTSQRLRQVTSSPRYLRPESHNPQAAQLRDQAELQRLTSQRLRQVTSSSQHLRPESLNTQGAQSRDQGEFFYIPPPVPRPQYLNQMRYLNQPGNVPSRRNSLVNQTSDPNI